MLDAANRLFCRDGYVSTTMAAIADEAGVAVQTLYLAFGSKVAILSATHDIALIGDSDPVPMLERPWVHRLRATHDTDAALADMLMHLCESTERVAPIYGVIQSAASDPPVAELLARLRARRIETVRALADLLLATADLSSAGKTDRLADILYAVLGVESYQLFVTERGWPIDDWRRWTSSVIERELPTSTTT